MTNFTSPYRRWNSPPQPMQHLHEIAFAEGVKAFSANTQYDCPYSMGTDEQKEWQRGVNYAYFKAQRKARSIERSRADKEKAVA